MNSIDLGLYIYGALTNREKSNLVEGGFLLFTIGQERLAFTLSYDSLSL